MDVWLKRSLGFRSVISSALFRCLGIHSLALLVVDFYMDTTPRNINLIAIKVN